MEIQTVTVIGATGTMGANVARIFASLGNAKVYCLGRDIRKVSSTIPKIAGAGNDETLERKLIPADFSMLEQCVLESDLVFESSIEDISVKTDIAQKIGKVLKGSTISCTGSSGLSITEIAEFYPEEVRGRFLGVHLFNPPSRVHLCELTPTKYTNRKLFEELREYLETVLFRTVVEVKDSPAFLANRIGFQFINEAMQYAERYKNNGGIDYIDAIIGPFTGRIMPPLVTADFVGLDVHKAIVDNIYKNTHDYAHSTFLLPPFAQKLIDEEKLGRKTGIGLYKTNRNENGTKDTRVLDLNTGVYRHVNEYSFPFANGMKNRMNIGDYAGAFEVLVSDHSLEAEICLSFLLKYIVYSLYAAEEVGYSVASADDVMATGFHWCPPLAMYQALSSVADVKKLIINRIGNEMVVNLERLIMEVKPSKYNYKLFF